MNDELPYIGREGSLSQRVADELSHRILGSVWPEGQRLPSEPELCAQLGVSRSVVRDAIRSLQVRGLVDVRQGFGTIVRKPSDEPYTEALFELLMRSDLTIGDCVAAREALDVCVAEFAAVRRTDGDLRRIKDRLDAMLATLRDEDWDRLERAHLSFHLALIEAAHLPALTLFLQPMQRIILVTGLPALSEPARWDVETHYVELHVPLYEAIAGGDPDVCRAAMREHYCFVRDPAYAELHAMPFRDFPRAQQRLRRKTVSRGGITSAAGRTEHG